MGGSPLEHIGDSRPGGAPTTTVTWPLPGVAVVALGGEHDMLTARSLEERCEHAVAAGSHVIMDLTTAEFIDSSTIAVLMRTKKRADESRSGFTLVLPASSTRLERVLQVSGVLGLLNRFDTVKEALEPLQDGLAK